MFVATPASQGARSIKMDPAFAIGFWAVLFIGSHLVISSAKIRPWLVGRLGEQSYRGLYSLVALATFIPLLIVFGNHKHAGPMLWNLRDIAPIRWLSWLLMLAALILLVAGLVNPNPGAIGAPSAKAPSGILKVTRHPTFVAIALFGFAHLLMNGWSGDVLFFGTFPVLGIAGGFHQDRRKLRDLGDAYRELMARTSFFPGTALLQGRQQWSSADTPLTAIGIGAAATILILVFHPRLFGGAPLG
jgi:uncharacterized membrane protein